MVCLGMGRALIFVYGIFAWDIFDVNICLNFWGWAGYGWGMENICIDAHCHFNRDADLDAIVMRARAAGVMGGVWNAVVEPDWAPIANASAACDGIWGAIGIHPMYAGDVRDGWDIRLIDMLAAHQDLMVGEIGMDKNYPHPDVQERVFARQIEIATEMRRVVHIHWVGMWDRLFRILDGWRDNLPPRIILHAFGGSAQTMAELDRRFGVYFSFGPGIFNPRRRRAHECVGRAPVNRILAESDGDDLAAVVDVVRRIGEIRGRDMTSVIYTNTRGALNNG